MKRLISLMLVIVMGTMLLAGCAKEEPKAETKTETKSETKEEATEEAAEEETMVIGYATKSSTAPFWVILNDGAEQAAKDYGVELIALGPPKENDIVGQLSVIEDLINREVDGLVVAPCDSVGVAPAVDKAMSNGTPVIAVDTSIEGVSPDGFVATNNYNAAQVAAEWMAGELDGKGNVVLLNGMMAQGSGKERYEGFADYMEANHPDINIVFSQDCAWEDEKALKAMEDAMAANDQIDGVFVGWDGAALAAHRAMSEGGRIDEVAICGFDAYPQSLKYMKEGTFEANVAQNPYKMGYTAVENAIKAAQGEDVDQYVDTGVTLITPETAKTNSSQIME